MEQANKKTQAGEGKIVFGEAYGVSLRPDDGKFCDCCYLILFYFRFLMIFIVLSLLPNKQITDQMLIMAMSQVYLPPETVLMTTTESQLLFHDVFLKEFMAAVINKINLFKFF